MPTRRALGLPAAVCALLVICVLSLAIGARLILVGIGVATILSGVNEYLITRANIVEAASASLWITRLASTGVCARSGRRPDAGADLRNPLVDPVIMLASCPPCILGRRRRPRRAAGHIEPAAAKSGSAARARRSSSVLIYAVGRQPRRPGPVAFVALCAPHLARRLTRRTGPNLGHPRSCSARH